MSTRTIRIAVLALLGLTISLGLGSFDASGAKKPKPPPEPSEPADPAIAYIVPWTELWVMDADGSNRTLIREATSWFSPGVSWSPDGKRLAFADSFDLYVMDIEVVDGVPKAGDETLLYEGSVGNLCWSPLDDRIVFEATIDGVSSICLIDASGGTPEVLYQSPDGYNVGNPAWNRDGTEIAFTEGSGGLGPYIKVLKLETEEEEAEIRTVYSRWPFWPRCLAWGRTMDVLVLQSDKDHGAEVYTLDLETGEATYRFDGSDWVCWSPDDSKLLYGGMSKNRRKIEGLWTYELDSGATEQLSSSGRWPEWKKPESNE